MFRHGKKVGRLEPVKSRKLVPKIKKKTATNLQEGKTGS
jgi:hypothetical protein